MVILAIDDEKNVLRVLEDAIRETKPDATVYACQSGREAMDIVKKNRVDVVFLDINLGSESGLDVGEEIRRFFPEMNIIFVTSYAEYGRDAVRLHASDYLMKPVTADMVACALENLIYPVEQEEQSYGIYIKTFGKFEVYVNGKPLVFPIRKAREMLAFLVMKNGSAVTRRELAEVLFHDQEYSRQAQDYLTKIYRALRTSLEEENVSFVLNKGRNQYSVNTDTYRSDMHHMQSASETERIVPGEYMSEYSWAEEKRLELLLAYRSRLGTKIEELPEQKFPLIEDGFYVRCFGKFDVYYDKKMVNFQRRTAKEILAYLIYLNGATATGNEICTILWENSEKIYRRKGYFRILINALRNTLEEYHMGDILECGKDTYRVVPEKVRCDYFRFLQRDPGVKFHGKFMEQYSWAEERKGELQRLAEK